MDRTQEFKTVADSIEGPIRLKPVLSPSPLLLKANELICQFVEFERLIESKRESYINYHRYLSSEDVALEKRPLPAQARLGLDKSIVHFLNDSAAAVQDINSFVDSMISSRGGSEESMHVQFYKLVLSHLLSKLGAITAATEKMQKEYNRQSINPFRLMSDYYYTSESSQATDRIHLSAATSGTLGDIAAPAAKLSNQGYAVSILSSVFAATNNSKSTAKGLMGVTVGGTGGTSKDGSDGSSNSSSGSNNKNGNDSVYGSLPSDFAQRYIDEVAPTAKLREYEHVAAAQKESLLKEAKQLKAQFSEDMQESIRMERTVGNISSLITEFASLIESQSEIVDTVGEVSKDTVSSVQQTDAELLLTLQRTQSHQWSMISFIVGLSLLLLVLDFVSP